MNKSTSEYYERAFSRNIGILSFQEQERLRNTRVALAGLGGVGGIDFLTLVRMGIGKFNIADFDTYSPANSNRQVGANSQTLGQTKISVMENMAREISPGIEINSFPMGFQSENAQAFLENADIVIDAIDFFCLSARELLYNKAREYKKTVLLSAPLGFSTTLHVFTPESMSFQNYFDFRSNMDGFDKLLAFAVGIAPAALHTKYMKFDADKISQGVGTSIGSACNLCSALVATELVSIVLGRKPTRSTPQYVQMDPYLMKLKKGRLIFGNRGPIQRLKRWFVGKQYSKFREDIVRIVK